MNRLNDDRVLNDGKEQGYFMSSQDYLKEINNRMENVRSKQS